MESELPYRLMLLLVTLANITVRIVHHRRAGTVREFNQPDRERAPSLFKEGRELTVLKLLMTPWLLAPMLYLAHPPSMAWAAMPLPSWVRWTGAVWSALCSLLLWRVHRTLDANFSPALRIREGHTLVTGGPYRWVRHPMYSMGIMAWLAAGLLTANWFIALGGLVFLVHSLRRIPKEEAMMIEVFGDQYRAYMERTGRLLPRVR